MWCYVKYLLSHDDSRIADTKPYISIIMLTRSQQTLKMLTTHHKKRLTEQNYIIFFSGECDEPQIGAILYPFQQITAIGKYNNLILNHF